MNYNLAPIILFVYNRLIHTQATIKALQDNVLSNESILIIYSDGAKNVEDAKEVSKVREYIKEISGFKSIKIVEISDNQGLAKSLINGINSVFLEYESIIVIEDSY